ncbi:hypothetical protein [Paenibacillus sp. y28]|uniref:hypothetical protein n=1 Tax=Paenibacillus sp. y28 TaxID=3129110 RepID=UPI00301A5B7A
MKSYLKLLNWEINRFGKLYGVLLLVTLLSQTGGLIVYAVSYMSIMKEGMQRSALSLSDYLASGRGGTISLKAYTDESFWFSAPIALCAAALLLYVFMIWYREWFGRNTFAYRLLMLPTSRMNLYWAKLSAIMLFVWGLLAFQLLLLPLEQLLLNALLPGELRDFVPISQIVRSNYETMLSILIPRFFIVFMIYYGAGLLGVIVIFTAILLERSFRVKGIFAGILYAAAAVFIVFSLDILSEISSRGMWIYPSELYVLRIALGALIAGISVWFSSYLLRKKVTV